MPHSGGLLEGVLAEQRAGILGTPAAAVEEVTSGGNTGGGGVLAALTSLFGGANDPDLTAEQNQSASRQARLRAGLQALVLSSRGDAGLTEILASAALTGQERGEELRTELIGANEEVEREFRIRRLVESGELNPVILQGIFNEAAIRGDQKTMATVTELLKTIRTGELSPDIQILRMHDPDSDDPNAEIVVAVDKNNPGAPPIKIGDSIRKIPTRSLTFTNQRDVMLNGEKIRIGTDPLDGREKRVPIDPSIDGYTSGDEGSTRDRVLIAVVGNAELFDIITGTAPPNFLEDMLIKFGLSDFVGTEQQQLEAVGEIISRTYVFMLSGVTARETEVKAAKKIFMPQRGNKAETLRLKRQAARRLESVLRSLVDNTASPALLKARQEVKAGRATAESLMQRVADGEFDGQAIIPAGGAGALTGRPRG